MTTIERADPTTPQARILLQASHDLMRSLFPAEANHFLCVEKLAAPQVSFFLARDADPALGGAALLNRNSYGEVKSMFVAEAARQRGIADMLMLHLIAQAREQGLKRLNLETGTGLDAAHRLYARHGFVECDAFGEYDADAPYSRYMELTL